MAEQITIEQAKTTRQQRKRVLTTRINAMGRYMAEEFDVDNIKERREQLKKTFAEFVDAHQQVESLCTTEKELDECLGYITEAETGYISVLRQTSEYVARIRADSSSSFERPDSRYVGGLEAVNRLDNSAIHLPKLEIEVFDGDPMRYHSFIAVFEQSVEKYCTDGSARLTRLLQYTDGKAKQAIRACSIIGGADGYGRAREILHQRFGEKHIISKSMTEKLRTRKAVRTKEEVRELADELLSCVLTLKEMGRVQEIDTQNTITDIIERLPRYIQNRWRRHAVTQRREQGTYPDIKDLVQFVTDTADEVTDPVYGYSESDNKGFEKKHNRTYVADMTKYESSQPNVEKYQCRVCRGNHGIGECEKFKGMSVPNRWELAKEQRLCFRCLGRGHSGQRCARSQMCNLDGCRSSHHKLLHDSRREARSAQSSSEQAQPPQGNERPLGTYVSNSSMTPSFVSMRTIPVILCNRNRRVKVNALLDEASSRSYVNEDVIAELGLTGEFQQITVNVLGGVKEQLKTMEVEFDIESVDRKVRRKMSAFTTKRVTGGMEAIDWSVNKRQWTHLTDIPFPHIGQHATVDILIGLDQADLLFSMQDIRGGQGEPIARLTPLGWTCVGGPNWNSQMHHANYTYFANNLDNILQKYWDIDEPHTHSVLSPDQELANNMAAASIKFEKDHYSIGIPWKDKSALGDNRVMALHRLRGTEKRLKQTPDLRAAYSNIIERYEGAGYIRKVPVEENPQQAWYLPHFPVIRPDKSTTKTRLVFDASARHNDVSLNDVVFQGPKLQNELFDVLLRARRKPIMIMCDVQEMYLQVALKETDRPFHRFLWRDCDSQSEPTVYEFNRLVFGLNSSPFLAQYVIQHHAKMLQKEYPLGAETILKSTYMDDSMDSVDDSKTAAELYLQLSALWQSAGMHARKWMSNCPELLELIPTADCQGPVDLDKGEPYAVKTLGVLWSPKEDQFHFQTTQPQENSHKTKRLFLKKIATLFDPLGFLAPYTMKAKMLLQDMWTSGADWDDDLDDSLATKARQWFDQLRELYQLRIPRCLRSDKEVKSIELHTFVDASQTGYGAVTYARYAYQDGTISCRLVASKTKVAPVSSVSIPRLELMAAIVGVRLTVAIGQTLQEEKWTLWSDSLDVLYWIRNRSRVLKPFVANRVAEIQKETAPGQWRYVPTKENPADDLSRGLSVLELVRSQRWWNGPDFLKECPQNWPANRVDKEASPEARSQLRNQAQDVHVHTHATIIEIDRLDPSRYSDWRKLIRILARVQRFINNCRLLPELRKAGELMPAELAAAEEKFVARAQQEVFEKEYKASRANEELPKSSKLLALNPAVDDNGLLRSNGRLQYAQNLPWGTRCPIILPRNHPVTQLIIKEAHEASLHAGTNHVLAVLSAKYWIISAREAIREWEHKCTKCRRNKIRLGQQIMAPLPEMRLRQSLRAFSQVSVDFAGPFVTKQGRGKTRHKRYLCLFTCQATRAVHLEMSYSMDTDSFLNAFFRMTSRRGLPTDVVSDNGTNFVGANKELIQLEQLDRDVIQHKTSHDNVKWHFNPPAAPHFNGVHEIMIKAAKRAINVVLGNAEVTDEELQTAIVGAEGLINSRPLTYQSADVKDLTPLTPNHFLHGQIGGLFAPEAVDASTFNPRKRWRRVQEIVRHFWKRWITEWIPSLNVRRKWPQGNRLYEKGDVVIVMSPDTPRGRWPLGRIENCYPGRDGIVRVVDVKVGNTVLRRPIVKLCLLEAPDAK